MILALTQPAFGQVAQGKARGQFTVSIAFNKLAASTSSCATRRGLADGLNYIQVACFTSAMPSFSIPGRSDVMAMSIDLAQSRSWSNGLGELSPSMQRSARATVPQEETDGDRRVLQSAAMSIPLGEKLPTELEVAF